MTFQLDELLQHNLKFALRSSAMLAALVFFSPAHAAERTLTLESAVHAALAGNTKLLTQRLDLESIQQELESTRVNRVS